MSRTTRAEHYAFQDSSHLNTYSGRLPEQLLNSVITLNGEPYLELDPTQLVNVPNANPNHLFFVHPSDASDLQPFLPSIPQHIYKDIPSNRVQQTPVHNDVISINDDSSSSESDNDQLGIQEHISYAVAKPYRAALEEVSKSNVDLIKHDEFDWKTNIKCDFYPKCKILLTSHYEKRLHMEEHTYPSNTTFKCGICNKTFTTASDRNIHVATHSVPDTYKCDQCLETFPYYTSYLRHVNCNKCTHDPSYEPLLPYAEEGRSSKYKKMCLECNKFCGNYTSRKCSLEMDNIGVIVLD